MSSILSCISVIVNILVLWLTITLVFQIIISIFGFKRKTNDYKPHDPKMRFLVLIPAHNEAKVISGIIQNMHKMQYPKELFDFYVLADNCTDDTAKISRSAGAKVLEFEKKTPDEVSGKSVVLKKALEALTGYEKNYDAVFFFDADNWVDYHMFSEVNSQFLDSDDRTEIIQCYLGSKNKKGIVAFFYYMTYTISNRFLQYSRQRLGINCGIGGTGFAVKTQYLYKRGGWTAHSLTEDTELQIAATLDGKRILWNNNARVYDEKPTTIKASMRQRIRWAQGHWFVAFKNTVPVIRSLFQRKISLWEFISMIIQLYFPATYIFATLNVIVVTIYNIMLSNHSTINPSVDAMVISLDPNTFAYLLFFYTLIIQFAYGDWVDNKQYRNILNLPLVLVSFAINTAIAGLAQIIGLFKYRQQGVWDKTEHSLRKPEKTLSNTTSNKIDSKEP